MAKKTTKKVNYRIVQLETGHWEAFVQQDAETWQKISTKPCKLEACVDLVWQYHQTHHKGDEPKTEIEKFKKKN